MCLDTVFTCGCTAPDILIGPETFGGGLGDEILDEFQFPVLGLVYSHAVVIQGTSAKVSPPWTRQARIFERD
jgi:hypothetical protein